MIPPLFSWKAKVPDKVALALAALLAAALGGACLWTRANMPGLFMDHRPPIRGR